MNTQDERRDYFRILDQVGIKYAVLGENGELPVETSGNIELSLGAMLQSIDEEFNRAVNILWSESPAAADAIGLLNRKLSLLAARSIEAGEYLSAGYEGTTASISGCGMAFHCDDPLAVGRELEAAERLFRASDVTAVDVYQLQPKMRLARPLLTQDGKIVVPVATALDQDLIQRVQQLAAIRPLQTPLIVSSSMPRPLP